jgi:hypothetical protein
MGFTLTKISDGLRRLPQRICKRTVEPRRAIYANSMSDLAGSVRSF